MKKILVEDLSEKLNSSNEKRLGYGNNPLVLNVSLIAEEKTMGPVVSIKTMYSIK